MQVWFPTRRACRTCSRNFKNVDCALTTQVLSEPRRFHGRTSIRSANSISSGSIASSAKRSKNVVEAAGIEPGSKKRKSSKQKKSSD
jgi:hypothetical protein